MFAVKTGDIAKNFLEDVNRLYPEFKHAKVYRANMHGSLNGYKIQGICLSGSC